MKEKVSDVERVTQMFDSHWFSRLRQDVLADLRYHYDDCNTFLKFHSRKEIEEALLRPTRSYASKLLRETSHFFYHVSPHYRRAITFFATLSLNNYIIRPLVDGTANKQEFLKEYITLARKYENYRFKQEIPKALTCCFLDGIFYGIIVENNSSCAIRKVSPNYARIKRIEDGVWKFEFDLNYFSKSRIWAIEDYGNEFKTALVAYRGDKEKGIAPDSSKRWYEPKKQVCLKFDEELLPIIPPFASIFKNLIDLQTYEILQKDKAMFDNYRLIHFTIPTDSDGVPKIPEQEVKKYYELTASVVPDGIGVTVSPFKAENFTLKNTVDNGDYVNQSTKDLFNNFGLNPLLFGVGDNPTSQTLELSVRPDEALVFKLVRQYANIFNAQRKKSNPKFPMRLEFLEQSTFNKDKVADSYLKAAQYGMPTKMLYMASLGRSPIDSIGLSYLEDDVLCLTIDRFNKPLVSSYTTSGNTEDNQGGRPPTDNPSDNTELNADNNSTYK